MSEKELQELIEGISTNLGYVFSTIYATLREKYVHRKHLNPALPYPQLIRIGVLDCCLAVEFVGPNDDSDNNFKTHGTYRPDWNVYDFIGLNIKELDPVILEVGTPIQNVSTFLGNSMGVLTNYYYDLTQQPSEIIQMGSMMGFSKPKQPIFVSNCNFFWTDANDKLMVKRVDFLEIIPFGENGEINYHSIEALDDFIGLLLAPVPAYRIELHAKLNEFIELINSPDVSEPNITTYLAQNPEILQLAFGVNDLNPQTLLEWQYETDYANLQPDFMPVRMDRYADIIEFKLPWLKNAPVVGKEERRQPSHEIDAAMAQLDLYEEWCGQVVNTVWLENTKGIRLNNPKRVLIIGHSSEFNDAERARMRKIRNTEVYTYDEFIEMARVQLYRFK